jgi:hypothetical protein
VCNIARTRGEGFVDEGNARTQGLEGVARIRNGADTLNASPANLNVGNLGVGVQICRRDDTISE